MKEFYTLADLESWNEPHIRLGVLGNPVAHSRSPQMMNAALVHCGLPHKYVRFQLLPNELQRALSLMRKHDFVGVNVTVPHKVAALSSMDCVEEAAQAIGAVNTVQFRHGKLRGFNTDAIGFARAIREEFEVDVRTLRVVILGTGGASRAVASECEKACVWSRREHTIDWLREQVRGADLIVNATPVGMNTSDEPLLTRDAFHKDQFLYDTIYEPARTKLMEEAAAASARIANGLSMLLHQGAAAFEIWFDRAAPLDVMRAALA